MSKLSDDLTTAAGDATSIAELCGLIAEPLFIPGSMQLASALEGIGKLAERLSSNLCDLADRA